MKLQLCHVDFPEVQQMSKEIIDMYDTHVQDVSVLAHYGFDLDYVKRALHWCPASSQPADKDLRLALMVTRRIS